MQNLTVDVKNESCEEEQTVSGPQIVPAAEHATEMQSRINKPIFVVGSPRSGTSILTWCLGQHPNILAVEESAGMGDLTVALAICYQVETARGDYSLLSSIDVGKEEFFSAFGETINQLILRHRVDLDRKRWDASFSGGVGQL
jgi:Sulfotransferase family